MSRQWPNTTRIDVGLDFGSAEQPLGSAAIARGTTFFSYDERFRQTGLQPSPIRMRVADGLHEGSSELDGLPGLLHDSLPDGWARLVLDRYLVTQGYSPQQLNALDRLALVSRQGMGALTFFGGTPLPLTAPAMDFDTAAELVTNAPTETDADLVHTALTLTGSVGGARPKAHVYLRDGDFAFDGDGGAPWIVKFPAKQDPADIGAVEYAYSLMARAAGVDMPPTRLMPSRNGPGFFAVERFDRGPDGARVHMHSFGGMLGASIMNGAYGYEQLMQVTGSLTQPHGDDVASIEQQIRRMAFNVLARNRDDHVKNHAFLMDRTGRWRPAPAFDLTYEDQPEHRLLVGRAGRDPGPEDMREVARAVHIPGARTDQLIEEVREATGRWRDHARDAGVGAATVARIERALNERGEGGPSHNARRATWLGSRGSGI